MGRRRRDAIAAKTTCQECGNDPCTCQERLEAYLALCPEDELVACGMCGHVVTKLSMIDGICEPCWNEVYD